MEETIVAIPFTPEMLSDFKFDPKSNLRWGQAFYNSLPEEFLKENHLNEENHPNKIFIDRLYNQKNTKIAMQMVETSFLLHAQKEMRDVAADIGSDFFKTS